jgi:hypothetical protein
MSVDGGDSRGAVDLIDRGDWCGEEHGDMEVIARATRGQCGLSDLNPGELGGQARRTKPVLFFTEGWLTSPSSNPPKPYQTGKLANDGEVGQLFFFVNRIRGRGSRHRQPRCADANRLE